MHCTIFMMVLLTLGYTSQVHATGEAVVIINPMASGGFEVDPTFNGNGWTVENGNQPNKWIIGHTNPIIGTRAAFVSKDTSEAYRADSLSIVHFHRIFSVPDNAQEVYLSFYYYPGGKNDSASYSVYVVPRNTPVVAGQLLAFTPIVQQRGSFFEGERFFSADIPRINVRRIRLNVQPGAVHRLVFTWVNRRVTPGPISVPAPKIDAIEVSATVRNPMKFSWEPRSSGTTNDVQSVDFAPPRPGDNPATGFCATAGPSSTLLIGTTNGGRAWQDRIPAAAPFSFNAVSALTRNNVIVSGAFGQGFGSTNGGSSFYPSFMPNPPPDIHRLVPVDDASAVAFGTMNFLFLTEDVGSFWTRRFLPAGTGTIFGADYHPSEILSPSLTTMNSPGQADTLVLTVVGQNGKILQSTNLGLNWTPRTSPTTNTLRDVEFADPSVGYAVGVSGTVLRTIDGGETWTQLPSPNGITADINALSFISPEIGIIALSNGMILRTLDSAATWDTLGSTTTNSLNDIVMFDPYSAIAVGAGGTIIHAVPDSVVIVSVDGRDRGEELPTRFTLFQNYPNPFNPTTTIRFEIPKPEVVSLKVYDVLGREVATLMNEVMQPGSYQVSWDASHMASGVYFYRLVAGSYNDTRKLALVK